MPRVRKLNFKCTHCEAAYKQAELLEAHINSAHLNIRPYLCPEKDCDKSFAGKEPLRKHMKTHDKKFRCVRESCTYIAADGKDLERHMYTHTGQKPFKCEVEGCNFATAQPQNLKTHMLFHSDTREFSCTYCEYAAHTKNMLEQHVRTHTMEKPYCCTFRGCERSFTKRSERTRHELVHNDLYPEKCRECGLSFRRAHHLIYHMKAYHSEESRAFAHREEKSMEEFLLKNGISFVREHHVSYSCVADRENNFARIDFLMMKEGGIICLEVDENQHRNNEIVCENARMAKVHESLALEGNTLPLMFIRFNPHDFRLDGKKISKTISERQFALLKLIEEIELKTAPLFQIVYMFYDSYTIDNKTFPQVFYDPDYDEGLKSLCTKTIV